MPQSPILQSSGSDICLYWISGSPPSWRVMLGLLLKGVAYRSRRLDTAKQDHKAPAYFALNPRGQVPTFVHGATVVRESIAILAYLDRAFDGPALFGATPEEAARTWQQVMDFESNLRPAVTAIAQILLRGEAGRREEELNTAVTTLRHELGGLGATFAEEPFLGGAHPSAADCWLYPSLAWIERAKEVGKSPAPDRLGTVLSEAPGLPAWRARVEALDGFSSTVPPHWQPSR